MVKRRKVLLGMGSLAAGSAAAMGTGAFTSVSANRGVQVSVADDASAFLSIERETGSDGNPTPNADEYVEVGNDGTVALDFTETEEYAGGGSGINKNATTVIDNLLKITNQGTQEVYVAYRGRTANGNKLSNQGMALYHEDPDTSALGNPTNDGALNYATFGGGSLDELPQLEPGETLNNVGAFFYGNVNVSAINNSNITFIAGDEPEDL